MFCGRTKPVEGARYVAYKPRQHFLQHPWESHMAAVKSNRSKKKLKNRAKTKKLVLKRRRVRARKAKGKY